MLNSWFGSKSSRRSQPPQTPSASHNDKSLASSLAQSTIGPVQTTGSLTSGSEVPLDEIHSHINDRDVYAPTPSLIHSAEKEAATMTSVTAAKSPKGDGTLFTPQDAIIAQVFGRSVPPTTADLVQTTSPLPSTSEPQPSASLTVSDSLPPQTPPTSSARPGPALTIYDPFSGAKLGERSPISPSMNTSTPGEASSTQPEALGTSDNHKLWTSLERILELQAEIAAMHAEMEGVGGRGTGSAHAGERSRRGLTLPVGDEEPEERGPESGHPGGAFSEISTDHSDGEDEDDEDDIFGNGKRRRDEEFARLAEQFAQRKTAIGGIMDKLDDLSTALKTFHALPPPLFDFATSPSRGETISSLPSNASGASSLPPLHVYPRRVIVSASVRLSISNWDADHSAIGTSLSSGSTNIDSGAYTVLGRSGSPMEPVIAPILPRTTVPTIIPGAPQVESPVDMPLAQSIFHGALRQ
ncbi:hypothetical protein JVU11DRAFT_4842 [Chiua virens]|nr:hypothetical protein JVU11DRAFT_4842 [Chiua virens]